MPKLSILLPTYNGEPFLAEQLETILAQTDGDFELIAVDDGSSDGTVDVLEAFAARDRRMSRLSSTGNSGQNARLMELLGHARSEFIAFADQDDRWAPERNALLFEAIGTCQMAFGRSVLIDKAGAPLGMTLLDLLYGEEHSSEPLLSLVQPMFSAHAMIVRRDRVDAQAFSYPLPFDWLLGLEAMFGDGVVHCADSIVFHRLHDSNQCNTLVVPRGNGLTKSKLREAVLFRLAARMRLTTVFDYLGRSTKVPLELRRKFLWLAQNCHHLWFSQWRPVRSSNTMLRDLLVRTLAPLAGSPQDLIRFERHIDVLTGRAISWPVLGEARRRLRGTRLR